VYDTRLGKAMRAVRMRRGWRQSDVAARAGISATVVSRIERGDIGRIRLDTIERVGAVLEIRIRLTASWRGSDLDRLLSSRHAALQERLVRYLSLVPGWTSLPEVSFSIRGERGVIDILAWNAATRTLVIIEVKTEIVDVLEMLGTLDRKRRLAIDIARERGWHPASVSTWLVVAESSRNRRYASAHQGMLRSVLPTNAWEMRRWLRNPIGRVAAMSFLPDGLQVNVRQGLSGRKRVRAPSQPPTHAQGRARQPLEPAPTDPTPA
jgi:transcriptional regulator with XRE-family HTH domain